MCGHVARGLLMLYRFMYIVSALCECVDSCICGGCTASGCFRTLLMEVGWDGKSPSHYLILGVSQQ